MMETARETTGDIHIAAAKADDVREVLALETVAFADPWSARSFHDALLHTAVYFACARRRDDRKLVGYVVAWFAADEGEIANLAVDPNVRRQGIGKKLLDAALAEGGSRGAESIYLEVRDSNASARELYGSRGFQEVGRRPKYYRRPVEDAIVLRRTLR